MIIHLLHFVIAPPSRSLLVKGSKLLPWIQLSPLISMWIIGLCLSLSWVMKKRLRCAYRWASKTSLNWGWCSSCQVKCAIHPSINSFIRSYIHQSILTIQKIFLYHKAHKEYYFFMKIINRRSLIFRLLPQFLMWICAGEVVG